MSRRAHAAVSLLLVVPQAHVRQLDMHFQTAWYDVFHRARPNQISHVLCMGPIVWVGLVFACLLPLPGFMPPGFDLGLVLAFALVAAYLVMDRGLGLVMAPVMAALWASAHLLVGARGAGALPIALVVLAAAGALQTWTHAFEDVPPPLSGTAGWVTVVEWRRTTSLPRLMLAFVLSLFGAGRAHQVRCAGGGHDDLVHEAEDGPRRPYVVRHHERDVDGDVNEVGDEQGEEEQARDPPFAGADHEKLDEPVAEDELPEASQWFQKKGRSQPLGSSTMMCSSRHFPSPRGVIRSCEA
jgi:uncharacterized membrane protein YGL010W